MYKIYSFNQVSPQIKNEYYPKFFIKNHAQKFQKIFKIFVKNHGSISQNLTFKKIFSIIYLESK